MKGMPSFALWAAFVALLGGMIGGMTAATAAVLSPNARVDGKTQSQWAAAWWKWALEAPTPVNPVLDETGDKCGEGQKGHVWFLAGTFGGGTITRDCTIPPGKMLLIPVISAFYGAFLNDPREQRTEAFLRSQVACSYNRLEDFKVTIDGVEVPKRFFRVEKSILFDVQLPEDNVFGVNENTVPKLLLSPSVDQGFYLFVTPLPPGEHSIEWTASQTCPFGNLFQDNTYNLTIGARR